MEELIFWGVVPLLIAVATSYLSFRSSIQAHRLFHYAISSVVLFLNALSLWVLYDIFVRGAWPTFIPHIVIAIVLIGAIAQAANLPKANKPPCQRSS